MPDPKVLVVIPSYNHADFIDARVRSVLDQSAGQLDVRLIDDGSTDQTMGVMAGITDPRLQVRQREVNSGSPFTAWIETAEILSEGRHDYVWIAESDDRAELDFLEHGLTQLEHSRRSVLYFTHSWYVDLHDLIIGHSINYLKKHFASVDWSSRQELDGDRLIRDCLLRGMVIPNMSSALMRADAFRAAVKPEYSRFGLAADWLFAIGISIQGSVIFDPRDANHFRHHPRTARGETRLARVVTEHMSATHAAYATGLCQRDAYRAQMEIWANMYRHERIKREDFISICQKVSPDLLTEFLTFLPG